MSPRVGLQRQWKHSLWIEDLEDDKKIKANKRYKTLQQHERAKYTPKKPSYTSNEGTKKVVQKLLGGNKGKKRFEETKKHWKVVWEDESTRTKLTEGWKKFAAKNRMCQEDLAPDIALHGDSYNDVTLVVPV